MPKYDFFDLDLQVISVDNEDSSKHAPVTKGSCACSPSGASGRNCQVAICCD